VEYAWAWGLVRLQYANRSVGNKKPLARELVLPVWLDTGPDAGEAEAIGKAVLSEVAGMDGV
jgi:hypothetical protein